TVYTFSIILAVFLLGLGIGSGAGALASRTVRPQLALGICQLLLALAMVWPALLLVRALPPWPLHLDLLKGPWRLFEVDFVRVLWAIFPLTLLWGASFPLALASAASDDQDTGRLVGGIYAANTAGAIAGALVFSLILIPHIGTQQSQRVLLVLSLAGALFALV